MRRRILCGIAIKTETDFDLPTDPIEFNKNKKKTKTGKPFMDCTRARPARVFRC